MTGGSFLRVCPFCGGQAGLSHAAGRFWAFCLTCGASGADGTREAAIAAWNRSPDSPSHAADAALTGLRSVGPA